MKKTIAFLLLIYLASCSNADRAKIGGYGDNFTIKIISCDTVIKYSSIGKVRSESNSDGYYFLDSSTGKLVEVSGTVIIEQK
jgi:hypothetical protein